MTHLGCGHSRERAVVERVEVDALSSGQVRDARIVLHGRVVQAILSVSKNQNGYAKNGGLVYEPSGDTHNGVQYLFLDRDNSLPSPEARITCMAIYEDRCENQLQRNQSSETGVLGVLVLRQCSSDPIQYERNGVFLLDEEDSVVYTSNESLEEHSITII
jgi:hypothetical protein